MSHSSFQVLSLLLLSNSQNVTRVLGTQKVVQSCLGNVTFMLEHRILTQKVGTDLPVRFLCCLVIATKWDSHRSKAQ